MLVPQEDGRFTCSKCNAEFALEKHLIQHNSIAHEMKNMKILSSSVPNLEPSIKSNKKHSQREFHKVSVGKEDLNQHIFRSLLCLQESRNCARST